MAENYVEIITYAYKHKILNNILCWIYILYNKVKEVCKSVNKLLINRIIKILI